VHTDVVQKHSSIASLQQALVVGGALAAIAWALAWWPARPGLALLGAGLIVGGYAGVLALEFCLLRAVGDFAPAPVPTAAQLLRAWWGEVRQAPRVFGWRQPFLWRAEPDWLDPACRGRRGVVFIHGFMCNRGFWTPWLARVRRQGHAFVAVNLEPAFGAIDADLAVVEQAVQRVTAATGLPPLLVCHSMGGLVARAWLRDFDGLARVHRIVTLGTPHRGTWLARFSRSASARQMRLASGWLQALTHDPVHAGSRFTCWWSACDNIVFPPWTATLPGADNRLLQSVAHVDLAFLENVVSETLALLQDPPL